MNICNSCFGGGAKYLGQSPVEESLIDTDAQKLLPKGSLRSPVISDAPGGTDHVLDPSQQDDLKVDKVLKKAEGGDSGTCVDELSEKRDTFVPNCDENEDAEILGHIEVDLAPPVTQRFNVQEAVGYQYPEAVLDVSEAYIEVPDPVQLTVSSIGSLGGILEDVPEHCELESRRDSAGVPVPSLNGDEAENCPLIQDGGGSSKPTPKLRHHSFGSQTPRTILTANPAEGNTSLHS